MRWCNNGRDKIDEGDEGDQFDMPKDSEFRGHKAMAKGEDHRSDPMSAIITRNGMILDLRGYGGGWYNDAKWDTRSAIVCETQGSRGSRSRRRRDDANRKLKGTVGH